MTPLAQRAARELTLPIKQRTFEDNAGILDLIGQDMHCFEVTALVKSVSDVMDESNVWPEIETMLPDTFLPSPVTWLEYIYQGNRVAYVLLADGDGFELRFVSQSQGVLFSYQLCSFMPDTAIGQTGRIHLSFPEAAEKPASLPEIVPASLPLGKLPSWNEAQMRHMPKERLRAYADFIELSHSDVVRMLDENHVQKIIVEDRLTTFPMVRTFVGQSILILDLINTPGLIGLKQHDPHRALARQLQGLGIGKFPLRAWSEVVVKTHTEIAKPGELYTGPAFHKCLHFVRSHQRRYQSGHVTIIPAHWRGDPALGIKRTRYRVAA